MSSAPPIQKICHFLPSKYTCLAYDKEKSLLAIGCETGQIAILKEEPKEAKSFSCCPDSSSSVEIMSFAVGKELLLTVLKNDPTIYLWNVNKSLLESSIQICSSGDSDSSEDMKTRVTCVTWSQNNYFYVGTDAGTVKILEVKEKKTDVHEESTAEKEHELMWAKLDSFPPESLKITEPFGGNVIAMQENKLKDNEVLLASSKGHCFVWTRSAGKSSFKKVATDAGLLNVWWSHTQVGKKFVARESNERNQSNIVMYDKNDMLMAKSFKCNCDDYTAKSPIYKVKPVTCNKKNWLVYATECRVEERIEESHRILSLYTNPKDVPEFSKRLPPFGNRIIDFECLKTEKAAPVIAVLTESEFLILETEDNYSGNFVSVRQSRRYPYLTSPVTCLQHCGLCTEHFEKYVKQATMSSLTNDHQEGTNHIPSELIATGHLDGSVRLWLCYGDTFPFSFECGLVVYTADYFDFSQLEDDSLKEITLVKVSNSHKYMNVVNKSGHVLLFGFGQLQQSDKPPSYEVVLNDGEDQAVSPTAIPNPSPKSLPTPPPHFRPCQWQKESVQLLHHFSCHYRNSAATVSVAVNCVDYNEQMGIWSIGTPKGLMILDLPQKLLLNVIGSEKKLLKMSGLNSKPNPSAETCDVVCVETVHEISLTKQAPQTSLWVATADKALGVFTVASSESTENDGLQKTGDGIKIINTPTEIVDILHFPISNDSMACVNIVLVYKTEIYKYVYEQDKCYSKVEKQKIPSAIVKSGIILNKGGVPHVASLLETNHLYILPLSELNKTSWKILLDIQKSTGGKMLFSSGGRHAVWCSDNAVHCYCPF